jgi:hypothetical protein
MESRAIRGPVLAQLASVIHETVYSRFYELRPTVFLCGGAEERSVRPVLGSALQRLYMDVFTAEDLFEDLLFGAAHENLLNLENTLADSVDAVVLVVESAGAIAELGAFANTDRLRPKLVCILDQRYRRDKSFINYGPLRLMRDRDEGKVVFGDFDDPASVVWETYMAIWGCRRGSEKVATVSNLVQAPHYVLSCVYLLEPVSRSELVQLVATAPGCDDMRARTLTTGALSVLLGKGQIQAGPDGFRLTPGGTQTFLNLGARSGHRHTYDLKAMDEIRVNLLTWRLRGKRLPQM